MQKETFQKYLYQPELCKDADLNELKEVLNEFPWFSSAGILLLVAAKLQSAEEFDMLIKKYSIRIADRKVLGKLLFPNGGAMVNNTHLETDREQTNEIPSELSVDAVNSDFHTSLSIDLADKKSHSVLEDDSLLEFSYGSKKKDLALSNQTDSENTASGEENIKMEEVENPISDNNSGEANFDRWIEKLSDDSGIIKGTHKKHQIIESFINSEPGVIRADKITYSEGDISGKSSEEDEGFITDTLAKIYVKQGLYNKAIYAYEKLCLKYPEKIIYFASQIEEIRNLYLKK